MNDKSIVFTAYLVLENNKFEKVAETEIGKEVFSKGKKVLEISNQIKTCWKRMKLLYIQKEVSQASKNYWLLDKKICELHEDILKFSDFYSLEAFLCPAICLVSETI